jgi:flagellar assembly factor FliW
MHRYTTKYFGRVDCHPDAVIEFPLGLPGFENERSFLLIEQAINRPLVFLQSLSRPDLCFLTLPVRSIVPDYQLRLASEDLAALGLAEEAQPSEGGAGYLCLGIVALAEDGSATANLLSPVVIHWPSRRGVQAVQSDSDYSHRHPLMAYTEAQACL